jgi:hypothetical protein
MFEAIGGILGGLFGGNKKAKQTAATVAALSQKVALMNAENVKQSKTILYLGIGLAAVVAVVIFIIVLKRRKK